MKWYSRLYRNQGNLFFGPGSVDWGEQIVLITGGASQSPFTLRPSNHLHRSFWSWGATREHFGSPQCDSYCSRREAYRHRELCVISLNARLAFADQFSDNITYYKCDVSKLEEVEAVAKKVIEEVCHNTPFNEHHINCICRSAIPPYWLTMLASSKGSSSWTSHLKISSSPYPCSLQDRKLSNLRARTFDVNALAHFWTLKTFLPEMIRNKSGHIVSHPHSRQR